MIGLLLSFEIALDKSDKIFENVPESKEGEANEEAQGSAKVRHHGYKIIIVNLKEINKCYIVVTRK